MHYNYNCCMVILRRDGHGAVCLGRFCLAKCGLNWLLYLVGQVKEIVAKMRVCGREFVRKVRIAPSAGRV